jgi:hypothetical protein
MSLKLLCLAAWAAKGMPAVLGDRHPCAASERQGCAAAFESGGHIIREGVLLGKLRVWLLKLLERLWLEAKQPVQCCAAASRPYGG